ncbi:MAG: MoxR family ATPase [Candidatus Dojkabacteria bacterium]|nr:MoxR family ATPase [Candidatus Dojkabacteria bacterium]
MTEIFAKPSQVKNIVKNLIKTRRAIFLWGPPGIGKSSVVNQVSEELGYGFLDVRLSQMSIGDIAGIPFLKDDNQEKIVSWAEPEFLRVLKIMCKEKGGAILLLDELNSALPVVLSSAYQLILDRKIGQHCLPDEVIVIAAGNNESDKGVTFKMPTPLLNRFIHLNVTVDFEDFNKYAVEKNFHYLVLGYLQENKNDLFQFDPKSGEKAFPTPRSWEFTSDILYAFSDKNGHISLDTEEIQLAVSGTIGSGVATKFLVYMKKYEKIPRIMDILTGKVKKYEFEDLSLIYSLIHNIGFELKRRNKEKEYQEYISNAMNFIVDNVPPEFIIVGVRVINISYNVKIDMKSDYWNKLKTKHGNLIMEI